MPAPLPDGAGGSSAIGDLLAGNQGAGAGGAQAALKQRAMQIQQIGNSIDQLAQDMPDAAQTLSQIKTLLKNVLVQAAQTVPVATASGQAVPTASSMGAGPQ